MAGEGAPRIQDGRATQWEAAENGAGCVMIALKRTAAYRTFGLLPRTPNREFDSSPQPFKCFARAMAPVQCVHARQT